MDLIFQADFSDLWATIEMVWSADQTTGGVEPVIYCGQVIAIDSERIEAFVAHQNRNWPKINVALQRAGVCNFQIFHYADLLFSFFEFHGPEDQYEERLAAVSQTPVVARWLQRINDLRACDIACAPGEFWKDLRSMSVGSLRRSAVFPTHEVGRVTDVAT